MPRCDVTKCGARCCRWAPLPNHYLKYESKLVREVECRMFNNVPFIYLIDDNGYCGFLTSENKCAIYEDRPAICRHYGDTSKLTAEELNLILQESLHQFDARFTKEMLATMKTRLHCPELT